MRFVSLPKTESGATLALWPATRQTGNFTAVAGYSYPVDTTSGAITVTLPLSPSQGDRVGFFDAAGNFNTNNATIGRNGQNIMGLAEDMTVSTQYVQFTLHYDATRGWRLAQ